MAPFNPAVDYSNNPVPDLDTEMVVVIKHSARGLADAPKIDVNRRLKMLLVELDKIHQRLEDIEKRFDDILGISIK